MKSITINGSYARRMGAFITDILFLDLFVLGPLGGLILKSAPSQDPWALMDYFITHPELGGLVTTVAAAAIAISLCYFAFFEWICDQTPGMALFKLRIVTQQNTLPRAIVRNLFIIPFSPFQFILFADVLYLFYSQEGQRWTESLTGSKVMMDVALPD